MPVDSLKKKAEEIKIGQDILIVSKEQIKEAKHGAKMLIRLSEKVAGQWKGNLSAVEEARLMRKSKRGY